MSIITGRGGGGGGGVLQNRRVGKSSFTFTKKACRIFVSMLKEEGGGVEGAQSFEVVKF